MQFPQRGEATRHCADAAVRQHYGSNRTKLTPIPLNQTLCLCDSKAKIGFRALSEMLLILIIL
jgi:hypothetical protein